MLLQQRNSDNQVDSSKIIMILKIFSIKDILKVWEGREYLMEKIFLISMLAWVNIENI